jgi:hypothetical protein
MSLSTGEQQALESIEKGLAEADPRLASMLAIFTRLTQGERMPSHESADGGLGIGGTCAPERLRRDDNPGWHRAHTAALLLWVLLTVALIFAMVTVTHGGAGICSAGSPLPCAGNAIRAVDRHAASGLRSR